MSDPNTPPPNDPFGQQPPPPPGGQPPPPPGQPPVYDPNQQGFAPPPPAQPPVYDPNADPQQGYAPPPPGYQQPYQQPYQGYGAPANPFDSRSTTILVLGILGLLLCQVLGPVAWAMGNSLKKEAEAAGFPEPGNAKAGRICGIIGTALLALGVLFYVIFFVIIGTASINN